MRNCQGFVKVIACIVLAVFCFSSIAQAGNGKVLISVGSDTTGARSEPGATSGITLAEPSMGLLEPVSLSGVEVSDLSQSEAFAYPIIERTEAGTSEAGATILAIIVVAIAIAIIVKIDKDQKENES